MAAAAGRALRLGSQLKEIRLHLCQTSGTSKGVRYVIYYYRNNFYCLYFGQIAGSNEVLRNIKIE